MLNLDYPNHELQIRTWAPGFNRGIQGLPQKVFAIPSSVPPWPLNHTDFVHKTRNLELGPTSSRRSVSGWSDLPWEQYEFPWHGNAETARKLIETQTPEKHLEKKFAEISQAVQRRFRGIQVLK